MKPAARATAKPKPQDHITTAKPKPQDHIATAKPKPQDRIATAKPKPQDRIATAKSQDRIELQEWSGPVSPRYQYKTHIVVTKTAKGATLSYEHEGVFSEGKPTDKREARCAVPPDAYETLWKNLEEGGVFSLADAALPSETKARVGISVSFLEASRDAERARIEYTLAGLKKAEGAQKRALVAQLKAWAEALAASAKTDR